MPNLRRNKMKWMLIILAFIAAKAQGQAIPLQDVPSGQVQGQLQDPNTNAAEFVVQDSHIVGGPQLLTEEEYTADPNFAKIDEKLRAQNNLEGYHVAQVKRQLVNGNNYWLIYEDADGNYKSFKVYASFSGDLEVKNEDQPTPIVDLVVQPVEEQPVTIVGGPVEHHIAGGPQLLTEEEYTADPNFAKIDEKLRAQNNLEGYHVAQVKRQLVNGNNYWLIYEDADGNYKSFKVYASFSGDLEVKNEDQPIPIVDPEPIFEPSTQPSTQPSTLPTVQPVAQPVQENPATIVGAPQLLSKEEYLADENFLNIDAKLRKENQLTGFDVTEVKRQLVNGNNYEITYKNFQGHTFIFQVYATFQGELEVQRKDHIEPQPAPVQNPVISPDVSTPADTPATDPVVPPTEASTMTTAQIVQTPIVGAPSILTKEEYLSDATFLDIDAKLRKQNQLNGYDVTEVKRQLVNGINYQVTYKNWKGDTFVFEVYASFQGELEVQKKDHIEVQSPPVVLDQVGTDPVTTDQPVVPKLSFQEIKKTPGFAISYIALQKGYSFFIPNAKIRSVTMNPDPNEPDVTLYDLVLDTSNGAFESILAFNNVTETPEIKSLVVYNGGNLRRM